jgi:hypothetical protein
MTLRELQIDQCVPQIGMPQQSLDRVEIGARVQQMSGIAVTSMSLKT